uniref:Chlorophyll a-b binding protein, chloroplastic n=1 Tax=Cryptomonas curvata TaxID=233186 RepID=A0A7S0MU00_9CRYP
MLRAVVLAASLASAAAFAPSSILPRSSSHAAKAVGPRMQASESVPFLSKPKRLDSSLPGYVGFDPLGLSDYVDVKWLQEGEIKNGRVAMLGVVGLIVPEVFTFPFFKKGVAVYDNFFQIPPESLGQIALAIGLIEVFSHKGKITPVDMFEDGRKPGEFGFDPLGFGKNPDAFKRYELAEIKNGRLAMIAIGGMTHHYFLTGKGPIEFLTQIPNFKSCTSAAIDTGLCV